VIRQELENPNAYNAHERIGGLPLVENRSESIGKDHLSEMPVFGHMDHVQSSAKTSKPKTSPQAAR
jgi:hypothetical protein